ncbi:Y+L amino acid transporter 2-like isoform X2 [Panulirus ornatus]|uniref:Y+L amino acid transporter 2-like isoform X2 n=1 Tax=Panulirus ornatus TaxID=150431 RepID=UPI003A897D92
MDVGKDNPPSAGHLSSDVIQQKDKANVKFPSTDAGSMSEQTIHATTSKSPNDTTSPDVGNTDHPPVPLRKKIRSFFQRTEEQKEEKSEKPDTQSPRHTQENSDDREKKSDSSRTGLRLKRELGLLDCVGIIVGSIIGTGIFVSPRSVFHYTGSVGMSLVMWAATGLLAMMGALSYTELGTMIPKSGGSITYLYEAYGPFPAFLEVWMGVVIFIPATRAIAALSFAHYILQPFFPDCQEPPQSALRIVGILLILLLTWINTKKVKWATTVQDVLAFTKVLALIMIIVVGLNHLARGRSKNFDDPMAGTNWDPSLLATAFYHTGFAYSGWSSLNSIMEEVKNPCRNMPLAIAISLVFITVVYILTNVAYFAVLSTQQMLSSTALAVTFGNLVLGVMAWIIPISVACSTGGSLNGSIFESSRVLFVSARRGHLPKVLTLVHAHNYTPITSLVFMVWLCFPILYFITSVFLTVFPVIDRPMEIVMALVIIASALPVYYLAIHRPNKPKTLVHAMDRVSHVCQLLFNAVPQGN